MKCKVCGAESGKYPLCKICNIKKEQGMIIKCNVCNQWHYINEECPIPHNSSYEQYLYNAKTLISSSEQSYFEAIKACIPDEYYVFPQINLAAFINRTDNSRYHNELFRNVDFLITDNQYFPKIAVEVNDQSHFSADRRERDEKVQNILEEAGIHIIKLWTTYGVNTDYIRGKITEMLSSPIARIHHFSSQQPPQPPSAPQDTRKIPAFNESPIRRSKKKQGCYIATCVYGSYDCPQVWTLRRYRDYYLSSTWFGRFFIQIYYRVSPILVKYFGDLKFFRKLCKRILDRKIQRLILKGYDNHFYSDKE